MQFQKPFDLVGGFGLRFGAVPPIVAAFQKPFDLVGGFGSCRWVYDVDGSLDCVFFSYHKAVSGN